MLRTANVPERSPVPTFLFSKTSEDNDGLENDGFDSDEEPTPPPVPTSMFWCFDDRPLRGSSVSLDELGLPLSEPSAAGEALSHWDNTDRLDMSLSNEEPMLLPTPLPRPSNRSASVVEELLIGQETIPAPLARSVLRSTCSSFPVIPEVPLNESHPDTDVLAPFRPRSPFSPPRQPVPLSRSPLGLLCESQNGLGTLQKIPEPTLCRVHQCELWKIRMGMNRSLTFWALGHRVIVGYQSPVCG